MPQIPQARTGPGPAPSPTEQIRAQRQDALFYTLLSFVVAVIATLVIQFVFALAHGAPPLDGFLGRVPDANLPWIAAVVLSRGILQPLNLTIFGFGVTLLALRLGTMKRDFKAFDHPYFAGIPVNEQNETVIGEASRLAPLQNVREIAKEYSGSLPILVSRLEAGSRRLAEEGDAVQVHAVMQAIADNDRDALESRYTLVRYLIWLIPSIGFLGTVVGIGRAIVRFTGFMMGIGSGSADFQAQMQQMLSGVAGQLGVAFDTTVLALFLSAIIVALVSIVQSRDEGLLSGIDEYCLRNFVSRISVPDLGAKHMTAALQSGIVSLFQAMQAQRPAPPGGEEDSSWREMAGLIDGVKESLAKSAESMAASADKISRALESGRPGGPRQPER
jgi:biopolymer transport protein ExbB/TolQ